LPMHQYYSALLRLMSTFIIRGQPTGMLWM